MSIPSANPPASNATLYSTVDPPRLRSFDTINIHPGDPTATCIPEAGEPTALGIQELVDPTAIGIPESELSALGTPS